MHRQFHRRPFRFICNLYKRFRTPVHRRRRRRRHRRRSGHGRQGACFFFFLSFAGVLIMLAGKRGPPPPATNSPSGEQYHSAEREAGQATWGHFSVLIHSVYPRIRYGARTEESSDRWPLFYPRESHPFPVCT